MSRFDYDLDSAKYRWMRGPDEDAVADWVCLHGNTVRDENGTHQPCGTGGHYCGACVQERQDAQAFLDDPENY